MQKYIRTEYSDDFFVLNDLQRPGDNEAEQVETFALMKDHVARSTVDPVEMHGQRTQASAARQTKRRVLGEDRSVQVYAEVCLHVLWTAVHHLAATVRITVNVP